MDCPEAGCRLSSSDPLTKASHISVHQASGSEDIYHVSSFQFLCLQMKPRLPSRQLPLLLGTVLTPSPPVY